jgi:DNA invertase Pin-like site-specific DNA recombinase
MQSYDLPAASVRRLETLALSSSSYKSFMTKAASEKLVSSAASPIYRPMYWALSNATKPKRPKHDSAMVEQAKTLRDQGDTMSAIANKLGVNRSTLYTWLGMKEAVAA